MKISKEFKVGIVTIVSAVMLYYGFRFLKGSNFLSREDQFIAIFPDVQGLVEGNPVLINGLTVGKVAKMQLHKANNKEIAVVMDIDKNIPINASSKVILASADLLGGKMLKLEVGNSASRLQDMDTIGAEIETGITEELSAKAGPLISNLDSASVNLNILLKDFQGTSKILNTTLESVNTGTQSLNALLLQNQQNIAAITANTAVLTSSLIDTEKKIKSLLTKFNSLGDSLQKAELAKTIKTTEATLASLNTTLSNINRGQGTLGKLAKNDSLYRNLNASTESLNKLLIDFKANPKRYVHFSVFGRRDKPAKK